MNGRIGGLLLLAAALSVGSQPANVAEEEIRDLIDRLDDDDYIVREAATDRLRALGSSIFPVIDRTEIERLDPEAAGRLRPILDATGWMPPDIRGKFDDAVKLLKSRDKLDRRKGLAAVLALDTRAAAGLRNILAQGEGTCEIRTTVDRHTYEGSGTIEASVALHNTGATPLWVCLPGTETPYVGKASMSHDINLLKRIEPSFEGFGGHRLRLGRCGGCIVGYINDRTICICRDIATFFDHFVLLPPGKSLDLGKKSIPLPTTDNITQNGTRGDFSETLAVASLAHGYSAQEQKPSEGWTFCTHTNPNGWVISDIYRAFRFQRDDVREPNPPRFSLLPRIGAAGSNGLTCRLALERLTLAKGEDIPLSIALSAEHPLWVWDPRTKKFPLVVVIRDAAGEVVEAGVLSEGTLGELVLTPDDLMTSAIRIRKGVDVSATLPVRVNLKEGNYTLFAVLVSRKLPSASTTDRWWSGSLVTNRVDFTVVPARVR